MDNIFSWSITNTIANSDEITGRFEKRLGIEFININRVEPNLCYIESEEVRDEYKTTFTQSDILNYIYAMQHSSLPTIKENVVGGMTMLIPYPKDTNIFWKLVRLGKELEMNSKDSSLANELIKAIDALSKDQSLQTKL